jgi:hypothetical protein
VTPRFGSFACQLDEAQRACELAAAINPTTYKPGPDMPIPLSGQIALLSLRFPARDSRCRRVSPEDTSIGAVPGVAGEVVPGGKPADVADLAQDQLGYHLGSLPGALVAGLGVTELLRMCLTGVLIEGGR